MLRILEIRIWKLNGVDSAGAPIIIRWNSRQWKVFLEKWINFQNSDRSHVWLGSASETIIETKLNVFLFVGSGGPPRISKNIFHSFPKAPNADRFGYISSKKILWKIVKMPWKLENMCISILKCLIRNSANFLDFLICPDFPILCPSFQSSSPHQIRWCSPKINK